MKLQTERDYEFLENSRLGRVRFLGTSASMTIALQYVFVVLALPLALIIKSIFLPQYAYMFLVGSYFLCSKYLRIKIIIRRLHDFNASGWWSLLSLIPYIHKAFWLFLIIKRGSNKENKFGATESKLKSFDYIFALIELFFHTAFSYYFFTQIFLLHIPDGQDIYSYQRDIAQEIEYGERFDNAVKYVEELIYEYTTYGERGIAKIVVVILGLRALSRYFMKKDIDSENERTDRLD